jgi:hypothetical protein
MGKDVIIDLDNVAVRFTSEGKISVIDAIRAVSSSKYPWTVWEGLKIKHPEILDHCEDYAFPTEDTVPVVDSEGLQMILMVLLEYLPEHILTPFTE